MKWKIKNYTRRFKEEAVKLITEQGYRVAEASKKRKGLFLKLYAPRRSREKRHSYPCYLSPKQFE